MRDGTVLRDDHLGALTGRHRAGLAGLGDADPSLAQLVEDLAVMLRLPPSLPGTEGVGDHVGVAGRGDGVTAGVLLLVNLHRKWERLVCV